LINGLIIAAAWLEFLVLVGILFFFILRRGEER